MRTLLGTHQARRLLPAACSAGLLVFSAAAEATFVLSNATADSQTYDVTVSWDNPPPAGTLTESITLAKGETVEYGGKKGRGPTKDKTVRDKDAKVTRNGVRISSITPVLDPFSVGSLQVASLVAAADGLADVYSFFDFGVAGYQALVATSDFEFIGFDPGRIPVLAQVGSGDRMTDAAGRLLAPYRYGGTTVALATILNAADVPEPPMLPLVLTLLAGLAMSSPGAHWRAKRPGVPQPGALPQAA